MLSYEDLQHGNISPEGSQRYIGSSPISSGGVPIFLDFLLSTALILLLYLGIPYFVAKFSKKQWSKRKMILFILCNTVICYFIVSLIKFALNPDAPPANIAAAAFWSFIASGIFIKYHPEAKK